ncbi:Peroxisome biosynthesis protein pex1 [Tilletia horrida]|uniref:Peroxisomal ATPase PEX1 n=1 Tax=Tilletia horrida TaxID=155126 RepID=A0AAN6GDR6_9BASI|nr:Peroxisome biosynthesis protein pex1 [Tilletia horrida]
MAASNSAARAGKLAQVRFDGSLRSQLCHLPVDLHAPLVDRKIAPQNVLIELTRDDDDASSSTGASNAAPARRLVLGWTGFSSAPSSPFPGASRSGVGTSSGSMPTIAIAPTVANLYSPPLTEGTLIRITLLRSPPLPTATRIDLVPLTPDDWEILSAHAQQVEDDMLAQVRGAATGMELTAHVGSGGRTVCRFRVEATEPKTLLTLASASSSAVKAPAASANSAEKLYRAVRLTTNTEVVIAPKTRSSGGSSGVQSNASSGTPATNVFDGPATSAETSSSTRPRQRASSSASVSTLKPSAQERAQQQADQRSEDGADDEDDSSSLADEAEEHPHLAGVSDLLNKCMSHIQGTLRARQLRRIQARSVASGASTQRQRAQQSWLRSGSCGMLLTGGSGAGKTAVCRELAYRLGSPSSALGLAPLAAPTSPNLNSGAFSETSGQANGSSAGPSASAAPSFVSTPSGRVATKWIDCTSFAEERLTTLRARMSGWLTDAAAMTLSPARSSSVTANTAQQPQANGRLPHSSSGAQFNGKALPGTPRPPVVATLLVLDNLDRLLPAPSEHTAGDASAMRVLTLGECFAQQVSEVSAVFDVFVLATAQAQTSLHPSVSAGVGSNRVFGEVVQVKPPAKEARKEILAHLISLKTSSASAALPNGIDSSDQIHAIENGDSGAQRSTASSATLLAPSPDLNPTTLATQTDGFYPADLKDLVERAVHQAAMRVGDELSRSEKKKRRKGDAKKNGHPLELTMADFAAAQEGFVPLSLRDVKLEKSTVAWSDIGGLHATRQTLRETLEWPTKYAAIFASCPLRLRSGLLLYGFPGCGKTLLASAVAKECGLNFISVKGPEILNKYIGASEKSVRDLFDRAQAARPCVLFFDEFDSIAPKRGHDSTGVTDRVVNQLLTQMDGAEGLEGVYVLAATSRPDLIDSALLRPGRLDKSLLCDMPDEDDRIDILRAIAGLPPASDSVAQQKEPKIALADEVDLRVWAKRTEGYSGADLQALLYNAHLETIHESIADAQAGPVATASDVSPSSSQVLANGDSAPPLKFVSLKSRRQVKAHGGAGESVLSGAEQQALRRRLELIASASSNSTGAGSTTTAANKASAATGSGSSAKTNRPKPRVTNAHLERSLASTRPSVPPEEQLRLRRIYRVFAGEREGTFPDGEASREIGARESLM